jgi:D-sedoheptulose 7-phosphate isomerase
MQEHAIRERVIRALREGAELRLQLIDNSADIIIEASRAVYDCLRSGGKVLLFGNGGSAADAQHIAAEFIGRFNRERQPLPAIALTTDTSALTAIANDSGFDVIFARQVQALCQPNDIVVAISTSGRSANVLAGVTAARQQGGRSVGLTGANGGSLAEMVDIPIVIPSTDTARIQECHITVGHLMCEIVDSLMGL